MLHLCKNIQNKVTKDEIYRKVRNSCHYTGKHRDASHSIWNLKFNVPNEISVHFQNGLNYNYNHFIIKELASRFER